MIPGLHPRFIYPMGDEFIFKTAQRANPSPSPRQSLSLSAIDLGPAWQFGWQWFLNDLRTSLAWLLLHHRAAIPVEGASYPARSGQCGEHLVHLDITPVSLSWVTQRMACFGVWPLGFGIGCSFTLEGLSCPFFTWPIIFVLKGPDQLSLVSLSLPPAGQVALLWPPQTLGSPLLVLITPASLGIYLLFYPVCLTQ